MRGGRTLSATLAVCVQFGLAALLLNTKTTRPPAPRETNLLFPIASRIPAPVAAAASHHDRRASASPPSASPPAPSSGPPSSGIAPQPDISGLGEMLFGCAPERYSNLPPESRMRCPKPGEGLAVNQPPDLMGTRSHVKNEAHWRQEWARVHSPALLPCGGFTDLLCLLVKIADGSLDDYGDPGKWPTYAVKQLPPADFRQVQDSYAARRDQAAPP